MILIDMPMPKTCGQCFCAMMDYDYNTVRCRFKYDLRFDANSRDYSNRRLDGCPMHEVTADPDTVSRKQVLDAFKALPVTLDAEAVQGCIETVGDLPPSPTPSRPKGCWDMSQRETPPTYFYSCSVCSCISLVPYNYCPNCGADMRGGAV